MVQFIDRPPTLVAAPSEDRGPQSGPQLRRDVEERRTVGTEQPLVSVGREHVRFDGTNIERERADALRAIHVNERPCVMREFYDTRDVGAVTVRVVHSAYQH